ncbi:FAM50 family protein [Trichophyton mentagrophytes]|nr:FAM50 family protein [Trichophyton mentagrophytes]
MSAPSEPPSRTSTPRSFTNQSTTAEDLFKSQTVGLVKLSDYRKRRAEVLEQKEREAHDKSLGRFTPGTSRSGTPSAGDKADGEQSDEPLKKKKKKVRALAKSKLSFGNDEDEGETEDTPSISRDPSEGRSRSGTPRESSPKPSRRLAPNPHLTLPRPKLVTKSALEAESKARDALRREFLALQEVVKATEIVIPFIFYDGTNIPAGHVTVKKGDPVWLFLDRCRKVGAKLGLAGAGGAARGRKDHRREWARVGVDDLMLVRGGVIIPHHYEFYYFIANRISNFSGNGGLLFDYSDAAPPSSSEDNSNATPVPEGKDADPTLTKVPHILSPLREPRRAISIANYGSTMSSLPIKSPKPGRRGFDYPHPDRGLQNQCFEWTRSNYHYRMRWESSVVLDLPGNTGNDHLSKTLREKCSVMGKQMDQMAHDANSAIETLQNRISELEHGQEQLQKKNQELVNEYREKCKKHAQMTNLYNLLKNRAIRSQIQTAVSDTVAQTLNSYGTVDNDSQRPSTSLTVSRLNDINQYNRASNDHDPRVPRPHKGAFNHRDGTMMPPPSVVPTSRVDIVPDYRPKTKLRVAHLTIIEQPEVHFAALNIDWR